MEDGNVTQPTELQICLDIKQVDRTLSELHIGEETLFCDVGCASGIDSARSLARTHC